MAYLLDTGVFIQAHQLHYKFSFCPAFWDWLVLANQDGRLLSLKQVLVEIIDVKDKRHGKDKVEDRLSAWAKKEGKKLFSPWSLGVGSSEYREVRECVQSQVYTDGAKHKFLDDRRADKYLIAEAKAGGHVLVTHEKSNPAKKSEVKIPDVCAKLGIECMNTFEMLEREKPCFVLSP